MKPILYQLLFRLIDYRLIMVCQFCEVTFVYGESLQWGFGFYLLLLYRTCNQIQGRTPVWFMSCVWSIGFLFWNGPIVTLGYFDPSDVCFWDGSFVIDWRSIRFWFLKWTSVISWSVVLVWLVGIHQTFGFWSGYRDCSWLTSLGSHQSLVSEVDLIGVVVRTFACWSVFNMRASVKHELLGHGFHDELFN
jgi:hypothetical protein